MREEKKFPQTKWQLTPHKETVDFQSKGNFEEDEKISTSIQCPFCCMDLVAGTISRVCGDKQTYLSKAQEEQAHGALHEGSACFQGPPKLRGNIYGQSGAQQQCGTTDHYQQALRNVSTLETRLREHTFQLSCGKMWRGPNLSRESPLPKTCTKIL